MGKKKTKLQLAQDEAQAAINKTNEKIDDLGRATSVLYAELINTQGIFDAIRNVPSEKMLQYEKLKSIQLNWKQQAEKIEKDYTVAAVKNVGTGIAGAGMGVAVVTMGPTVAMGVATTFGVASTGTAISSLSGAAATSAALAWLGGGALAAGGGGMAAGSAFLALAGPVGWAIAGVTLITSGVFLWKSLHDKKQLEDIFTLISKRDVASYELTIVEINERIVRILDECKKLHNAISDIISFGLDYNKMSEAQQYSLGAYVNLMYASTQLLVNPILGLQPKFTEPDLDKYIAQENDENKKRYCLEYKSLIIFLANFLFKIEMNDKEKKLVYKTIRNNKKMLESLGVTKKEFNKEIIDIVIDALKLKDNATK